MKSALLIFALFGISIAFGQSESRVEKKYERYENGELKEDKYYLEENGRVIQGQDFEMPEFEQMQAKMTAKQAEMEQRMEQMQLKADQMFQKAQRDMDLRMQEMQQRMNAMQRRMDSRMNQKLDNQEQKRDTGTEPEEKQQPRTELNVFQT